MARNFTEKQVIEAVSKSRGIVSVVARSLGCDWNTARKYIDKFPKAKAIEVSEREVLCDQAESVVVGLMQDKDSKTKFNAATYILDRLGKHRGFSVRQEVDHTTLGKPITQPKIVIGGKRSNDE